MNNQLKAEKIEGTKAISTTCSISSGTPPRSWLELNLGALRENFIRISRNVSPCAVMPILKANAYGLGVKTIAAALTKAGARRIGVADAREALELTDIGSTPQIIGALLPEEIPAAIEAGVILPITDTLTAHKINREAAKTGKRPICHVLIDSGMGRLGIPLKESEEAVKEISELRELQVEGIYSHFPLANQPENPLTKQQISNFKTLINRLRRAGIFFTEIHIANSDGINNFPEGALEPFNLVRSGINLYGAFDVSGGRAYQLHRVLAFKSRLAQVRRLAAGTRIGYGHTYQLPRKMVVGTVSAGYADGVPTALSNRGKVLIQGRPCRIIGKVSMDYITVSLENAPSAKAGNEVILIGETRDHQITIQDWAGFKKSNTYDIICSFGNRVERRYLSDVS